MLSTWPASPLPCPEQSGECFFSSKGYYYDCCCIIATVSIHPVALSQLVYMYSHPPIVFAALCLPLRKFFTMFISNPVFDCISIRFRNVHLFSPCWIDCFRIVLTENLCAITAPTVYPLAQCVIIYVQYIHNQKMHLKNSLIVNPAVQFLILSS